MRYKTPFVLPVLFFFVLIAQTAFGQTPLERVKERVSVITGIIVDAKQNQTLKDTATEDKLWASVDTIFDFEILSQKSLGKNWLAMNDAEKNEFISLFRKLLGRSYLNKITSYENENIKYLKELYPSPEIADVFTTIESKGQEYSLNYRFTKKNDTWKIYDVTIEGSSLLNNYRTQFNEFLKKNSIQELLVNLKSKVEANKSTAK